MAYIDVGNGPGLVANCVATLAVTWAFFLVRIYVRWFMMKVWKVEDWLFVGSQFFFTLLAVCSLVSTIHGNGQRLLDIKPTDLPVAMEFWFVCEIFYVLTAICIRLSFGFFLLRICNSKLHLWTIKITMAVMSAVSVGYFFFAVFQCHPVRFFWLQFSGLPGKCLPAELVQNVTIVYSVFAAITDLIFGILPIFVIWSLKMNPKAKMVVGVLLALGIISGLTVIVRIEYIKLVNLTADFLFATSKVSIWSMIEPAIGICCIAASTYRPLFSSLHEKATGNKYASGYKKSTTTAGSIPANPNFRQSRSMRSGTQRSYLKGVETHAASHSQGSFDDVIALESMAAGPGKSNQKKGERNNGMPIGDKGIYCNTTVEITRQQRVEDIV